MMKIVVATIQDAIAFSNFDYNEFLTKINDNYKDSYDFDLNFKRMDIIYDEYINNGMIKVVINHNNDKILGAFIITYPGIGQDASKFNQNVKTLPEFLSLKFKKYFDDYRKEESKRSGIVTKIKNFLF